MKKTYFLKTLFVAACLCMGGNAWAQATSLYERGTTNAWAASDVASGEWSAGTVTAGLSAAGGKLSQSGTNSGYSSTKTISPTSGYKVAMTAVVTMGIASGRSGSYDYITIGGVELRVLGQDQKAQVFIDGVAQGEQVAATRNVAYTFNVLINQTTGNVTYSVSGGATIAQATTSTSTAISNVVVGHYRGGRENYETTVNLTNISITEEAAASTASVTYKYEDTNGTDLSSLKADAVKSEEVGANISDLITSALTASFYNGDNSIRYDYSTFVCKDATVPAGGTTVTLKFTPKAKYTYTVTAVDSESKTIGTAASGYIYAGDVSKVYFPYAVNIGGTWYTTEETDFSVDISTGSVAVDKVYAASSTVVGFIEGESGNRGSNNDTYSGGYNGSISGYNHTTSGLNFGVYGPGKYKLTAKVTGNATRAVALRSSLAVDGAAPLASVTSTGLQSSDVVEILTPSQTLYLTGRNSDNTKTNQGADFDYAYLERVGDATVSKEISSAGYATYCSPYALDFEGTGLTAYIATATADKVSFSEVSSVPANTGVLLKGDADTYNIPVVASSATDVSDNVFVGVTEATPIAAETGFVLMASPKVGFYKNTNAFTVGANTAYIPVANIPNEGRSFIGFDDETTGISSLNLSPKSEGSIYNLNGQRVQKAQKGLYIQGGKKFVVK